MFFLLIFFYRRKVHQVLESAIIRHIHCVVAVDDHHTTFKSHCVHNVVIQRQRHVLVSKSRFFVHLFWFSSIEAEKSKTFLCALLSYTHTDNWSEKGKRRKTTGTGRCRYLKIVRRRFRNGFREGGQAKPKNKSSSKA